MSDKPELRLAESFGEIARSLLAERDPQATLERTVLLAVEIIEACEHASITVVHHRIVSSPAASDDIPVAVERLQAQTGEGPCLDAIRQKAFFQTGQLSAESRWPNFAPRASNEFGIESILAFRLFSERDTMGALDLYSTRIDAFDDHDVAVGAVFATHAAVALSTSQEAQGLRDAIDTRGMIGQATGMLMAREDISAEAAFDILVRASQRLNIKLRTVAENVVHSKTEVPTHPSE